MVLARSRMNFVQPGGSAVCHVAVPSDYLSRYRLHNRVLHVNVNHSPLRAGMLAVRHRGHAHPDGEPMDAEKLQVGSAHGEDFEFRAAMP